jgi:predicted secreted hydrolase
VWNGRWGARLENGVHLLTGHSLADRFGIDLTLQEGRPAALNGDRGFSQKSALPGNATHYYSLTRMPTRGTITIDDQPIVVEGASWMDHEFGTSVLDPSQTGWDWFSIQLADGTDLMLYRLRAATGSTDPHSSGTIVGSDGRSRTLTAAQFTLDPTRVWTSRATQGRYPVEWHVQVGGEQIDLHVRPALDAQELATTLRSGVAYWEGAIEIEGTHRSAPVTGRGYLELTGYAGRGLGQVLSAPSGLLH